MRSAAWIRHWTVNLFTSVCLCCIFNIHALDGCETVSSVVLIGGYSVLGWNHPGFGGSTVSEHHAICSSRWPCHNSTQLMWCTLNTWNCTCFVCVLSKNLSVLSSLLLFQGVPFPQNEANAMDVVIQFAVHKLGFQLSDIIVYAWSIGGFTGKPSQIRQQTQWFICFTVMLNVLLYFSQLGCDVIPRDPSSGSRCLIWWPITPCAEGHARKLEWVLYSLHLYSSLKSNPNNSLINPFVSISSGPLVTHTVRQYMNLNNAEQLCKLVVFVFNY